MVAVLVSVQIPNQSRLLGQNVNKQQLLVDYLKNESCYTLRTSRCHAVMTVPLMRRRHTTTTLESHPHTHARHDDVRPLFARFRTRLCALHCVDAHTRTTEHFEHFTNHNSHSVMSNSVVLVD